MSLVCGGVGEQNGELFTAQSCGEIGCSQRCPQCAGNMPERPVARLMTMLIIDLFEVVQVQHQHGQRGSVAEAALALLLENVAQACAVGETRQRIGLGHFQQARFGLLPGDLVNMGEGQNGQRHQPHVGNRKRLHQLRCIVEFEEENHGRHNHEHGGYQKTQPPPHQKVRKDGNQQNPGEYGCCRTGRREREHHGDAEGQDKRQDPSFQVFGVSDCPENENRVARHANLGKGQGVVPSLHVEHKEKQATDGGQYQQRFQHGLAVRTGKVLL